MKKDIKSETSTNISLPNNFTLKQLYDTYNKYITPQYEQQLMKEEAKINDFIKTEDLDKVID